MPTVSVIIPYLDPPVEFFEAAVESVIHQTMPDWELILVDDGSVAPARGVAERFAGRFAGRIRHLAAPDPRPSRAGAARNVGVKEASAELVAFLDADDVYEPDRLARHVEVLRARPDVELVVGDTLYWSTWSLSSGAPIDPTGDYVPLITVPTGHVGPPDLAARIVAGDTAVPCICSITVRRSAFEAVGGFEPDWSSLYEDQVLLVKLLSRYRSFYVDEALERYRVHSASVTRMASPAAGADARREFLDWVGFHVRTAVPPELRGPLEEARRRAERQRRFPLVFAFRRRLSKFLGRLGAN